MSWLPPCPKCGFAFSHTNTQALRHCPNCGCDLLRELERKKHGSSAFAACKDRIRLKPLSTLILLSLFLGFITATAGLAIFPDLGKVTRAFVCSGEFRVESERYALVNSESGVNRRFYCAEASGELHSITLQVALLTFLIFSFFYSLPLGALIFSLRFIADRKSRR